ncbi:MAG: helix-turn-helix domain-containing protein [Terracidiphilus sp.]
MQQSPGTPSACVARPEMIYVHMAADEIGCSRRTIRRLILDGILPARREGRRRWLILRADVEWVRRRRGSR